MDREGGKRRLSTFIHTTECRVPPYMIIWLDLTIFTFQPVNDRLCLMLYCLLDAQMPVTRGQKRRRDAAVQGSTADSHPVKRAAILNKSSSTTVPFLIPTVIRIIVAPPSMKTGTR